MRSKLKQNIPKLLNTMLFLTKNKEITWYTEHHYQGWSPYSRTVHTYTDKNKNVSITIEKNLDGIKASMLLKMCGETHSFELQLQNENLRKAVELSDAIESTITPETCKDVISC